MTIYRERAHLLALLATHYPAAIYAPDDAEDGFHWALALTIGGVQCSWHLADDDIVLFPHVRNDPAVRWDGTTTEQKYAAIEREAVVYERAEDIPREGT